MSGEDALAELDASAELAEAPVPDDAGASVPIGDCPELCGWEYPPDTKNKPRDLAAHRKRKHGVAGAGHKGKRDTAPRSVRIELNAGKARGAKDDPALAAVEERARQFAGIVAMVVLIAGQGEDAADIERGKGKWAESVRNLAVHEEWLRKLGEGGEASARVMAWLQFAIASGVIALPILMRHGAIPAQLAQFLSMAVPVEQPPPADEHPAAA